MVINKGREYDSMSEDKIEAIGEVEDLKKGGRQGQVHCDFNV
jgi:hypothetical protein